MGDSTERPDARGWSRGDASTLPFHRRRFARVGTAALLGLLAAACTESESTDPPRDEGSTTTAVESDEVAVRSDVIELGPTVVPIEWTADSAALREIVVVTDEAVWFRTAAGLEAHDIETGDVEVIPIDAGGPLEGWAVVSPENDVIWAGAVDGEGAALLEVDLASRASTSHPVPYRGRGRFIDHRHLLVEGDGFAVVDTTDGRVLAQGPSRPVDGGGASYAINNAAVTDDAVWIDWSDAFIRIDAATGATEEIARAESPGTAASMAANGLHVAKVWRADVEGAGDASSGAPVTTVEVYDSTGEASGTFEIPGDGVCYVVPDDAVGFIVICQHGSVGDMSFDSWHVDPARENIELVDRLAVSESYSRSEAPRPASDRSYAIPIFFENTDGEPSRGALLTPADGLASVQQLTMPAGDWVDPAFVQPQGDGWHMIGPDQAVAWHYDR